MNKKIERLKRKGVVMTLQRLAILDFLEGTTTHPTVEEIYRNLKKKYPTLSQATIYTSLQVFRKAGEIQELSIRKGKTCFDPNPKPHHHFYCQECKKVLDIEISCPVSEKGWVNGHKVKELQAYFYGTCRYCLKKRRE
jgi:Fur family peroxide stress response transcriptional regulator